jgi:hypothetical protein
MELRFDAGLSTTKADPSCPDIGSSVTAAGTARTWGDVDCSGTVNPVDSLKILRSDAGLTVVKVDPGCDNIGDIVAIAPGGPGSGITFAGPVPSSIDGEEMLVEQASGDELQALDANWETYFFQLGVGAAGFDAAMSAPGADSDLSFRVIALTAGVDWTSALAEFVAAIEAAEPGTPYLLEHVVFAGRAVVKVSLDGSGDVSTYYYASGNTIWVVDAGDAELAQRFFEELPSGTAALPAAVPAGPAPVPGQGVLVANLITHPQQPVCIAEPYGRQLLMYIVLDANYQVPVPVTMTPLSVVQGSFLEPVSAGAGPTFHYQAEQFGNMESITVQAVAWAGGAGNGFTTFPIQHCLNGTWQDGSRVIRFAHTGSQVTGSVESGTICDEPGGVAYSGTLTTGADMFSGENLKVCNPDDCVSAGLLPAAAFVHFDATISFDGNFIDFEWTNTFFDIEYENGVAISCTQSSQSADFFTISRLSFGPDVP